MSGLSEIRNVIVPTAAVSESHAHLQNVGRHGLEGLALWVGVREGEVFRVREALIPRQRCVRSRHGVGVTVDAQELHRLNRWLYETQATVVAQLHSHPTNAYHSETDDEFPIATLVGSLSLVVPDFARRPFLLAGCAAYRLQRDGAWVELPRSELLTLITITD